MEGMHWHGKHIHIHTIDKTVSLTDVGFEPRLTHEGSNLRQLIRWWLYVLGCGKWYFNKVRSMSFNSETLQIQDNVYWLYICIHKHIQKDHGSWCYGWIIDKASCSTVYATLCTGCGKQLRLATNWTIRALTSSRFFEDTVEPLYNTIVFHQNTHKRHPIARP